MKSFNPFFRTLFFCLVVASCAFLQSSPGVAAESGDAPLNEAALVVFSGVPRACAGGLDDELHTIRLTARLSPQGRSLAGEKISFEWLNLPIMAEKFPQPYSATLLDENGKATRVLEKSIVANGEIKIAVRSGRQTTQSILVARHEGREVGRVVCDFGDTLEYRRFPDKEWPDEEGDGGWFTRDTKTDRINDKVFLKFQRDDRRGDVPGNWATVAGHQLQVRLTVTTQNNYFTDFEKTRNFVQLVDEKGKSVPFLTSTTRPDGTIVFQHEFTSKIDEEFNYGLHVDDLTIVGEDEARVAAAQLLPMSPVMQEAWNQTLRGIALPGAAFGDILTAYPAPNIRGKLAIASTISPGVTPLAEGAFLSIVEFPDATWSTHDLALSNLFETYPLQFTADGDSVLIAGGPLPKKPAKPRQNNDDTVVRVFDDPGSATLQSSIEDWAMPQALYRFAPQQNDLQALTPVSGSFPWFSLDPQGRRVAFLNSKQRAARAEEALPPLLQGDLHADESEENAVPTVTPRLGEMPVPAHAAQSQAAMLRAFIQSFSAALPDATMANTLSWTQQSTLLSSSRVPVDPAAVKAKAPVVYANTYETKPDGASALILPNAWGAQRSSDGRQTAFFTFEEGVRFDGQVFPGTRLAPYGTALHVQKTGEKPRLLSRIWRYPQLFWLPDGRLLTFETWSDFQGHEATARCDINIWNTVTGMKEPVALLRAPVVNREFRRNDFGISTVEERDIFTPIRLSSDGRQLIAAYTLQGGNMRAFPLRRNLGFDLTMVYAIDLQDGVLTPLGAARGARGMDWWDEKSDLQKRDG